MNPFGLSSYPMLQKKQFWKLILIANFKSRATSCSWSGLRPVLCGHWAQLTAQASDLCPGWGRGCCFPVCRFSQQQSWAHTPEGHTKTQSHRGHRHSLSHRQPQARGCLEQHHIFMTHARHKPRHVPSSWADRGWRLPVQCTRELSRFTSTFTDVLSTVMAILPAQHPCLDPIPSHLPHAFLTHQQVQLAAYCKHTTLTHS